MTKKADRLYKLSCERCTKANRQLTRQSICKKCIESGNYKYFTLKKGLK